MASLQHVYRRGHIFWWRRIHSLFSGLRLDVRLSLQTANRLEARNRGAALTASTGNVLIMLNDRIGETGRLPTEDELQQIAKAMYHEKLVEICTDQRSSLALAEHHAAANRAYVDYFQRLTNQGGHMSLLPGEEQRLLRDGWSQERLADLREVIRLYEEKDLSPLRRADLDRHLAKAGLNGDDQSRWMLSLAAYPAYRDAFADAQAKLDDALPTSVPHARQNGAPVTAEALPTVAGECMSDFVEQVIDDRVADEEWDPKSGRQARSTVALFELLIGRKPFAEYTKGDFASFMRKLRFVPERYDMSSAKSRAGVVATVMAREGIDHSSPDRADEDKRSNRTRNRHLSSLRAIYRWAKKNGKIAPDIDFEILFTPVTKRKRARNERPATPTGDVTTLFNLPVYRGCLPHSGGTGQKVLRARFAQGDAIVHDAFYWVPLLLYYTGARREEICKLSPNDILFDGMHYIWIDFTESGRLKNDHSVRPVPLHHELLRLGFVKFAAECHRCGYDVLFPELRPTNDVQNFGDVYYKNVWKNLAHKGGLSDDATNHGMRHRFSTELKVKKVFSEFRRDLMGQAGININEERYSEGGPLDELKAVVEELPAVTGHMPAAPVNLPLQAIRRPQPRKRHLKN